MIRPSKQIPALLSTLVLAAALVIVFAVRYQSANAASHKESEKAEAKEADKPMHLFGNHSCPVSDDPVDPKSFVVYKDEEGKVHGRLYTCCEGCNKKTEAKAEELYKKFYLTDAETGKAKEPLDLENEKCPISGKEVDASTEIEYNGMLVAFCCDKCPAAFLKEPNKNLEKIVPEDVAKEHKYEFKGSHSAK
jgi:YHS domain-containing protein